MTEESLILACWPQEISTQIWNYFKEENFSELERQAISRVLPFNRPFVHVHVAGSKRSSSSLLLTVAYCIFLVMNSFHKWNYLFLSLVFSIESFEGHLELGQKHTQLAIFMWESWTCHRWKSMLYYLCICSKGDKKFISYRLSVTNSIELIIFALSNMNYSYKYKKLATLLRLHNGVDQLHSYYFLS